MIRKSMAIDVERIMRFMIDDENNQIIYYLALGHVNDQGDFVRAYGADKDRPIVISNHKGGELSHTETLVVGSGGVINLDYVPLSAVSVKKGLDVVINTVNGQKVTCEGVAEGEEVNIFYYYDSPSNMAFDIASAYKVAQEDVGKDFRKLTGERSWLTLSNTGEVEGVIF